MSYGYGYDSDLDSEYLGSAMVGGAMVGGKFAKGKSISYEDYRKMWKARHGTFKGAKVAYEILHNKKVPKKKATKKKVAKKVAKKKVTKKKVAKKGGNPWIKFLSRNGGKGYTRIQLAKEYKKDPKKNLPKKK